MRRLQTTCRPSNSRHFAHTHTHSSPRLRADTLRAHHMRIPRPPHTRHSLAFPLRFLYPASSSPRPVAPPVHHTRLPQLRILRASLLTRENLFEPQTVQMDKAGGVILVIILIGIIALRGGYSVAVEGVEAPTPGVQNIISLPRRPMGYGIRPRRPV